MRIQRPQLLIKGNIREWVAVGEKIVVRRSAIYKLPPTPNWIIGRGGWIEIIIDGILNRGWFKDSDIYLRVDPFEARAGQPLAYIIPSRRGEDTFVLPGDKVRDILTDARLNPRFRKGALFVKTSP